MEDINEFSGFESHWTCEVSFGINEARAMYDSLQYAIKMWPGYPARPAEEQEFLYMMRDRMFLIMMEYNVTFNNVE